jgi:hypothetical protein
MHEEPHGPRFLGENDPAFLFGDGVIVHQLSEGAAGNRVAPDIA